MLKNILILLVLSFGSHLQAQDYTEIYDKMMGYYQSAESFEMNILISVTENGIHNTEQSKIQVQGDKYRYEYGSVQVISSDHLQVTVDRSVRTIAIHKTDGIDSFWGTFKLPGTEVDFSSIVLSEKGDDFLQYETKDGTSPIQTNIYVDPVSFAIQRLTLRENKALGWSEITIDYTGYKREITLDEELFDIYKFIEIRDHRVYLADTYQDYELITY